MMCEDVLSPAQVLDGIASLLDKSLLHRAVGMHGETRYAMLETVREFALEWLVANHKDANLRQRHAYCLLRLIERAEQWGRDPGFIQVRRLVDDETHNMRAALAWAMQHDVQTALMLTAALLDWFEKRGPFTEGSHLIDKIFALPGASERTIARVRALVSAAELLVSGYMTVDALAFAEDGLFLSQDLRYDRGIADALYVLARIAIDGWQDLDAAVRYLERSLASFRTIGDPVGMASVLYRLAVIAIKRSDLLRANAFAQELFTVAQQGGFRFPNTQWVLGDIAYAEGHFGTARMHYEHALAVERQRGGEMGVYAATLIKLVTIATHQGDFPAAHTYLDQASARKEQFGNLSNDRYVLWLLAARLAQEEADYRNALRWYRASLPGIRDLREFWSDWCLGLADLSVVLEQYELASRLLGVAEAMDETNYRLLPLDRQHYNRLTELSRAILGGARFDAACEEGRDVPIEQVNQETVAALEAIMGMRNQASAN